MKPLDILISELIRCQRYVSEFVNQYKNKSILITGATGFIGYSLVYFFETMAEYHNLKLRVIAQARNTKKASDCFSCIKYVSLEIIDDNDLLTDYDIDFIFHCSSPTKSQYLSSFPVETIDYIYSKTKNILEVSKKNNANMIYLSSMEVYGQTDNKEKLKENDLGYINIYSPRSSYPESKRLAECLCHSFCHEYNTNVKTVRLCQIFGPGIDFYDNRIMSYFCKCVIEENPIILKTKGHSVRNLCYITDAIIALIFVQCKGLSGKVYNIANPNICLSIKDTAEFFCKKYHNTKLIFDINDNLIYPPDSYMDLDITLVSDLGWIPKIDLDYMISTTIEYLRRFY